MACSQFKTTLFFYGLGIEITSSDADNIENIRRDFSFFEDLSKIPKLNLEIINTQPDYRSMPRLRPSSHSPRNFSYHDKNMTFIDYFGNGLLIIDRAKNKYTLLSKDPYLRHEIAFLTILSLAGQYFDSNSLHRVHGLGLEVKGRGILILMPQGGGKTTLMLEMLKNPDIKLISEDTPLINSRGELLPFPIRIGIDANTNSPDFPDKYLRIIKRMEFEPKYLLDIDYFQSKVARKPCKLEAAFEGIRCLGSDSSIESISKLSMLKTFVVNSVIGVGVYQGIEFLIQSSPFELIKKSPIFASRLKNSWKAVSAAKTYSLMLGYDKDKNVETLANFLRREMQ